MTILNYTDVIDSGFGILHFTGRDGSISKVVLTNQESKKEYEVQFQLFGGYVQFGFREFTDTEDITNDSTFSIELLGDEDKCRYSDIIVFEGRMDTQSDYTENTESGTGYVFG
jgi:hypothetical protein